jgi:hypothetical protein
MTLCFDNLIAPLARFADTTRGSICRRLRRMNSGGQIMVHLLSEPIYLSAALLHAGGLLAPISGRNYAPHMCERGYGRIVSPIIC